MAINKVVYDGRTLIDITDSTVDASHLAEGYIAYNASGQKITGELSGGSTIIRDEQDSHGGTIRHIITDAVIEGTKQITSNGTYDVGEYASAEVDVEANLQSKTVNSSTTQQTVTADSGYDGLSAVTVNAIATATQATPSISVDSSGLITASATQTAGYVVAGTKSATQQLTTQAAKTVTPTESSQTAVASGRYTTGAVTVGAISSTYVGSDIDRNDSTDLTASGATVTVPSGYYASSASKSVASGSATTPATTITANPSISVGTDGKITATTSASKSITPTVSAGYVSSGTAGTVSVSGSATQQLTTKSATTYTPTTTAQTIASGTYLTGAQTIAGDANLVSENIAEGVSIFGVQGSHSGGASNFVEGTFTTSSTGGVTQSISIPYSGNGYPISWTIEPTGGFYGNTDFYNLIQRYVTVIYCGIKMATNTSPVWSTAGVTSDQSGADVVYKYKNSTSSSITVAHGGGQPIVYTGEETAYGNASQVVFKNATTMCVFVASTSYGFAPNIEYTYRIVYSE